MKYQSQPKRGLGTGILLGALVLSPVIADDIEIYVGTTQGNAVNPNVLFILDNSGSMTNSSLSAPTPFNPATTYSGSYDSAYYYRAINGTLPTTATTGRLLLMTRTSHRGQALRDLLVDRHRGWTQLGTKRVQRQVVDEHAVGVEGFAGQQHSVLVGHAAG